MPTSRTTTHIARPTEEEAALLRLLSADEKLRALIEAARVKADKLTDKHTAGQDTPRQSDD